MALSVQGCEVGLACAAQEGACAFRVPRRGASPGACPAATPGRFSATAVDDTL